MILLLPTLAVVFAAICVWLTVRIVNRRKRPGWRFWCSVTVIAAVAYPLSIGPMLYFHTISRPSPWMSTTFGVVYWPLETFIKYSPESVSSLHDRYCYWWIDLAESQLGPNYF